jgi:hypothetical protein
MAREEESASLLARAAAMGLEPMQHYLEIFQDKYCCSLP